MGMTNTYTIVENGQSITKPLTIDAVWDMQESLMDLFARTHDSVVLFVVQKMDDVATRVEDGLPLQPRERTTVEQAVKMLSR
jgi:hypothetical protein